jgi:hypothetical protein
MADLDKYTVDELIRAIENLTEQMGRGHKGGNSAVPSSKGAQSGKSGSAILDGAAKMAAKELERATKKYGEGSKKLEEFKKKLDEANKQTEKNTKSNKELDKATRDLEWQMQREQDAVKGFGKELLLGTGSIKDSMKSLTYGFEKSGSLAGRALFGFATGASFALSAMTDFAQSAANVGGFADLGAFKVGSVRQAKLMSGLGDSFIKVIAESNQGFKAFGNGSQDAMENLSDLSRGFRAGSWYTGKLNSKLGKEFVKDIDRASTAVSELGMSQEDQATLTASIAQQIAISGKRGDEAQKALAKQFADTAESARNLSNTFGVSAKDVIESINSFKRSLSGQTASTMGIKGAEDIKQALMAGTGMDDATANQIGLLMANEDTRDKGMAFAISKMGAGYADTINAIGRQAGASGAGGANFNASQFQTGMRDESGALVAGGKQNAFSGDQAYMEAKQRQMLFGQQIQNAQKNEGADAEAKKNLGSTTSEAGNIKSMDQLTAALNSLRNVILTLEATMIGIFGLLTPLIAGGIGAVLFGGMGGLTKIGEALGGIFSKSAGGGLGKVVGGIFSKGGGAVADVAGKAGGGVLGKVAGAGGGVFGKIGGAMTSGMSAFGDFLGTLGDSKSVKGAATLAILGGALALAAYGFKEFGDVKWEGIVKGTVALGGLIVLARFVAAATTDMIKGSAAIALLGASLWVAGKGLQTFSDLDWKGLLIGGVALAGFAVIAAVMGGAAPAILLGALAIAGLGAALWVFGQGAKVFAEAFKTVTEGIKTLGEIDGSNLIAVGLGLAAVGAGMLVFTAGMIAGTASSIITGIISLFGAKSPLDKIKEFVPIADKISLIGAGIKDFGQGIININAGLKGFDADALSAFKDQLVEFAKAGASDEVRLTAKYLTDIGKAMTQIKDAGQIQLPSSSDMSIPGVPSSIPAADSLGSGETLVTNRLNSSPLTPEILSQAISYMSEMVNDLNAIRGNTRSSDANSLVRLS